VSPASFVAKVISDGRITIPNEIRDLMGVNDGDLVVCSIRRAGKSNVRNSKTWSIKTSPIEPNNKRQNPSISGRSVSSYLDGLKVVMEDKEVM